MKMMTNSDVQMPFDCTSHPYRGMFMQHNYFNHAYHIYTGFRFHKLTLNNLNSGTFYQTCWA